jgi:3-hydroxyacyl-[acyl-carrier-protein] dehydratase
MPLNNFFEYHIESFDTGLIKAKVIINAEHPLFKGHFPGQPVTPGVVLIEIIRQILSETLNKKLMLHAAKDIKFTAVVIPTNTTKLDLAIDYSIEPQGITTSCVFSGNGQTYTKLRGNFREE